MEAASFCDEQGEEQKIQRTAGRKEMSMDFRNAPYLKPGYNAQVYFGVPELSGSLIWRPFESWKGINLNCTQKIPLNF